MSRSMDGLLSVTRVDSIRLYGQQPGSVVLLHGGPGAPGEMAPVAREISELSGTLEPLLTAYSIEGQLQELLQLLTHYATSSVILVGWSWGAMLAYLFASRYPALVKKLVLLSSAVFEEKYAQTIMKNRLNRLDEREGVEFQHLLDALSDRACLDKNKVFAKLGDLIFKADSFNPLPEDRELLACQYDVYQSVWQEARELRQSKRLLELGKQIQCPVVAIHGDYDPHPFEGIYEPLLKVLSDFRWISLEHCGHHPWLESQAKERFYEVLRRELLG